VEASDSKSRPKSCSKQGAKAKFLAPRPAKSRPIGALSPNLANLGLTPIKRHNNVLTILYVIGSTASKVTLFFPLSR